MKNIFIAVCVFSLAFCAAGCKKKGVVSFCEGVDKDGKGVNCGTVFSTGDMTAVFNSRSSFGSDTVDVKIFNVNDNSRKPAARMEAKVSAESSEGSADIEMYDEGNFRVEVRRHNGDLLSEGTIEIVDTYVKPE